MEAFVDSIRRNGLRQRAPALSAGSSPPTMRSCASAAGSTDPQPDPPHEPRRTRLPPARGLKESRQPSSLAHLVEQLGVSRATLKRDIEYVRDFVQVPIDDDGRANGYRYAADAPAFELPGL